MKKSHIVMHHSATKDSGTASWNAIRRYHMDDLGWRDIGYHLGIEYIEDATGAGHYEALMGRDFLSDGAHCYQQNMNKLGLGVVLVGDFDTSKPPAEMLRFCARHVRALADLHDIPIDEGHIHPHNEFAPKTCPGINFPWELFIKMLRGA